MTCEERKDLLLLYAADQLDSAEREALRAHLLTGCPTCAGALAEAQAVVAQMASAAAPIAPPKGAFDKLMKRIEEHDARRISPTTRRSRSPFLATLLAVAAAIAITTGLLLYLTRDARSFFKSKDLATVTLTSSTQPKAHGQVWWDRDRQQWRVTVTDLGPAPTGREYELWFIPAGGAPMRSQTFKPDGHGSSTIVVNVPSNVGALATAAITDEPFGGTDAPTGQIHLAGQFH